jgi:hypothetical protein
VTIYDELEGAKSYEDARAKYDAGKSKIYTPFVSLLAQLERLDLLREAIFDHGELAVDSAPAQTGTLERFVSKHSASVDAEHKVQARELLTRIIGEGKGNLSPEITKIGVVRCQLQRMGYSVADAASLLMTKKVTRHSDAVNIVQTAAAQGWGCCL